MKFVSDVNKSIGIYVFGWLFSSFLARYSVPLSYRTEHITSIPLMLLSCGLLRQNMLMVSPGRGKKISILDL